MPNPNRPALFDAVLRNDFAAFTDKVAETLIGVENYLPNWHIEAVAHEMERCFSGDTQRLAIFVPPRHLKSIVVSIAFPAWVLGHRPKCKIVVASHSLDLSLDLARQFRTVVECDWYRRIFPHMRANPRKDTELEFVNAQGGGRLSVSVGSSITGRGGDIIIIDDPMKAEFANSVIEEARVRKWYDQSLSTRLNNKRTGIEILVMQRLSVGDLAAHVMTAPDWHFLTLRAIAEKDETTALGNGREHRRRKGEPLHPEHEDQAVFERLRHNLGTAGFAAQYQQAPVPSGGGSLPLDWFARYRAPPHRSRWERVIHSWDTAASVEDGSSFSVWQCWVVVEGRLYLIDQIRRRMYYPDLRRLAFELMRSDAPDHTLVERASTGLALADELWALHSPRERRRRVPPIRVDKSKEQRAINVSPYLESGRVLLPQDAPFLAELEEEIRSFPGGPYDDQVDAMTQAVQFYFSGAWKQREVEVRLIGARR